MNLESVGRGGCEIFCIPIQGRKNSAGMKTAVLSSALADYPTTAVLLTMRCDEENVDGYKCYFFYEPA